MKLLEIFKKKSEEQIIKEIHNEFDTAPDRLLKAALEKINENQQNKIGFESELEHKALRLQRVGFTSNGLVKKLETIQERNKAKEQVVQMTIEEAERIQYYAKEYPFHKFLTESELDRICDKYGLIYAPIANYKMPVPEKNLEEIENRKRLNYNDGVSNSILWNYANDAGSYKYINYFKNVKKAVGGKTSFSEQEIRAISVQFGIDSFPRNFFRNVSMKINNGDGVLVEVTKTEINKQGLFIAAPKKHFDLKGLKSDKRKGYFNFTKTIVKSDPIVFEYVRGGVLCCSKWGLEANDPALQIEILN